MEEGRTTRWQGKFRMLIFALVFSGALNIALLTTLVFLSLEKRGTPFSIPSFVQSKRGEDFVNAQVLSAMRALSFRELLSYLTNRDLVEEGFAKRDLALATLVAFHHFNLEKALCGASLQRRAFVFEGGQLELFSGLTEEQFQAILKFAYEEKWPFTAEGLFHLLKRSSKPRDQSLAQAFFVTPEFYALQILFQQSEAPQDKELLLDLICEGNWDLLDRFCRTQAQRLDLSVERREHLLLSYLSLNSPTAAKLLLKTDFHFALKKLDDAGILALLEHLDEKTPEAVRYCVELLRSPRTDAVWQSAAEKLYHFSGEPLSSPVDLADARQRFLQQAEPYVEQSSTPAHTNSCRYHVVTGGETLWKIMRTYDVSLDELVQLNELEGDRLYPGMTLKIPEKR